MAWSDRVLGASFVSPSGITINFDFEALIVDFDKRGTAFDFPDADGTYIQNTGKSSRRMPMTCYIWGEDYDLAAVEFIEALAEPGDATLNHPQQGAVKVVALGRIRRRDDLVNAANQAVVEVEFFETTGLIYPSAQTTPRQQLAQTITGADDASADQFASSPAFDTATSRADFITRYNAALTAVDEALAPIYEAQADVARQFRRIEDSINRTIQTLVGDPLTLAYQTQQLIKTPARVFASVSDRLSAYRNLLESMLGSDQGVSPTTGALAANDAVANSALLSQSDSAVDAIETDLFRSRTDALNAAVALVEQLEAYGVWRDDNQFNLGTNDAGATWQTVHTAICTAAGALVEESFKLRQERRLVLTRNRTVVDLCAQLYKSVDDSVLDTFIITNELNGDEIREVPDGREVVYYV